MLSRTSPQMSNDNSERAQETASLCEGDKLDSAYLGWALSAQYAGAVFAVQRPRLKECHAGHDTQKDP